LRQQLPADRGIGPRAGVGAGFDQPRLAARAAPWKTLDLTSSLVDLITAQRNYQANAQTIKTQQTVDQTSYNL